MKIISLGVISLILGVAASPAGAIRTEAAPTCREARVSAVMASQQTANLFGGKARVGSSCARHKNSRVCIVRITGPTPMRLRVTVWETPTSFRALARMAH